ncbi:MAG: serine hydrolase domain-containing protein, partial [Candidatus Neomarinimicrobiota bacterium]
MNSRWLSISQSLIKSQFLLLILLMFPVFASAQSFLKGFNEYVDRTMRSFDAPGVAIGIVKNDSLIYSKGFGVCKLGTNQVVDENTLFAIGSISKSTVAVALGLLVDEDKLKWDDRVTQYLPDFQLFDPWVTREITIRDLLTHRSGLISESGGTIWYGSDYDRAEVVQRLRYLKPVTSFRYKYAYQNVMYLVAGEIIPAVTGQTWDEFVKERIFGPLGMRNTNTHLKDLDNFTNVSIPHAMLNGHQRPISYRNYDNVGPACSVNSTVVEMAQYVRLLLNGGVYKGQRLYSEAVARELFNPQTVVPIRDYGPGLELMKP